jgi:hypothetical protein
VAYLVAIAWSAWGPSPVFAWPVTMVAASIATALLMSRDREKTPETTLGRALGSIWIALAVTMFVVFAALGFSGRIGDVHVFVSIACGLLGLANAASSMMLRWKVQFAAAVGWWTASVLGCFGSANQSLVVFVAAVFLCQIVFGIYGMMCEARERKQRGTVHA